MQRLWVQTLVWEKSCPYCRRIAELEAENKALLNALEKMTADRDGWKEASELWREDSNNYMNKWLNNE